jgi:hypothetical protein
MSVVFRKFSKKAVHSKPLGSVAKPDNERLRTMSKYLMGHLSYLECLPNLRIVWGRIQRYGVLHFGIRQDHPSEPELALDFSA